MPDSIAGKVHRMARQQKNNPGLIFANDDNDDGMAAHGPPMADTPPLGNLAQQLDNPPGQIPGVEAANEAGEHGMAMELEIPGVGEEEAEPEIPGVGREEDKADDDVGSIQDEVAVELPLAAPEVENNTGGRYDLHGGRNQNYDHCYAGEDFVVDNEVGITMTTKGCSEVLETPQMSSCTQKQKYIGTRKHNLEAVGIKWEHRNEDLDGPRDGHFLVNVQETTLQATGGADKCMEQPDAK